MISNLSCSANRAREAIYETKKSACYGEVSFASADISQYRIQRTPAPRRITPRQLRGRSVTYQLAAGNFKT
jgi:hypothetical protein